MAPSSNLRVSPFIKRFYKSAGRLAEVDPDFATSVFQAETWPPDAWSIPTSGRLKGMTHLDF